MSGVHLRAASLATSAGARARAPAARRAVGGARAGSGSVGGPEDIREWARQLFALRRRTEASGFALVGVPDELDRSVVWRYRAHVDLFQQVPGVPPAEGIAIATTRSGAI